MFFDFYVQCSVTRCLLVTTLSREASLTIATERLGWSRPPRQAYSCTRVVYREDIRRDILSSHHYFYTIIEIFFGGARHVVTHSRKLTVRQRHRFRNDMKGIPSSRCLMQNGLNSHAHLRVNLAAIN